jgi:biotin carboxylase
MTRSAGGTLLVYGAGVNQVPVLEAGRRRGWRVVAIDRDPKAPGIGLADRFICTSMGDHEAILRAVEGESLRGVVARVTDAGALDSSRRLSDLHGLASPGAALLEAATSKRSLARLCRGAELRTPQRFESARTIDFARGAVCVRPDVTVRGKAAIRRVSNAEELVAARGEAEAASANGESDVSTWIEGADVSVLAVLDRGRARRIALFDEWVAVGSDGRISGLGAGMPSIFEADPAPIDSALTALARACPESDCLVTLSLRIDEAGRAFVIEVHLGVGGDALADRLLPAALPGFDAFDLLVSVTAGEPASLPPAEILPRALLRSHAGWRLVESTRIEDVRDEARAAVPADCEVPFALRRSRPGALASF